MDSESGVVPLAAPFRRTSAPAGLDSMRRLPPAAAAGNCQRSFQYTPAVMSAIATTTREAPARSCRRSKGRAEPGFLTMAAVSTANSIVASAAPASAAGEPRFPNAATILVLGTEGRTTESLAWCVPRFFVQIGRISVGRFDKFPDRETLVPSDRDSGHHLTDCGC